MVISFSLLLLNVSAKNMMGLQVELFALGIEMSQSFTDGLTMLSGVTLLFEIIDNRIH